MIGSFEGKNMYRMDYSHQERVRDGEVTKEASAFFMAESPEAAIAGLRELMEPTAVEVQMVGLAMPGADIRFKQLAVN